jgi:hypothetical protein
MACGQQKKTKRVKSEAERGAVTEQFGQYGVIKEADMWDKRPEFMLWCSEVRCFVCAAGVGVQRPPLERIGCGILTWTAGLTTRR